MGAGPSKRDGNGAVVRRHSWAVQDASNSLYKSFGGSFKQLQCVLHEFGSHHLCRSENYLQQKGNGAVVGLHSSWIGDSILACARPSDRIIETHHLIFQYIASISHGKAATSWMKSSLWPFATVLMLGLLQERRSHELDDVGVGGRLLFTATQELFDAVFHLLKTGAAPICCEKCREIFHERRTGLVIACYLLYSGAQGDHLKAIQNIRQQRPGTLKNKYQVQLVKRFDTYLRKLRIQFIPSDQWRKSLTRGPTMSYPNLQEIMVRQNELLHGLERQALHYVPKIVDWLSRELIKRTEFDREKREQIACTFMTAFTTDLNLSADNELVQKAKARINAGDWGGIEDLATVVLCHLLLEWLYQLQEPMVPDFILTTALGRGDIESAIDELSKCDSCSFATLQCLVCWMFQMVPVKPNLIRRVYSALAHVFLANTSLQTDQHSPISSPEDIGAKEQINRLQREVKDETQLMKRITGSRKLPSGFPVHRMDFHTTCNHNGVVSNLSSGAVIGHHQSVSSSERNPNTPRRHTVNRMHSVFTKYKPSLLEIELGLLLEAAARFWIKLGVARHEEIANKDQETLTTPGPSARSASPQPSSFESLALKLRDKHRMGSFSQPWFRDRASLQYEQYNPSNVLQYHREMDRGSIGGSSRSPSPLSPSFEEKKPKTVIQKDERKLKGVSQEEKNKPVHHEEKKKPVVHQEMKKPVSHEGKNKLVMHEETKRLVTHGEKKKPVPREEVKKPVPHDEKKVKRAKQKTT